MYNMVHGVNPFTFIVLPMLGKHPDEYPRFRDCFGGDESKPEYDGHILVYTRTGGSNRADYWVEISAMRQLPEYVADYDDAEDDTYAMFVFSVPERWTADYEKIINGKLVEVSDEYKDEMCRVYPKLADKFNEMFGR
jgi:hypothetical protein